MSSGKGATRKKHASSTAAPSTTGTHSSIQDALQRAISVPCTRENIDTDLNLMASGDRSMIAIAKPYLDNKWFSSFDLTQHSAMGCINDVMRLFNFVLFQYSSAQAMFTAFSRTCPKLADAILVPSMLKELTSKPIARYMDFVIGGQAPDLADAKSSASGMASVSLPVGAIGVIVYQFPNSVRCELWPGGHIDCTSIIVPEKPTEAKITAYNKKPSGQRSAEGSTDPLEEYKKKMLVALLKIMSLPPRDMITFLMQGSANRQLACEETPDFDPETKSLLSDRPRMEGAVINYAGIADHPECRFVDYASYFSFISAVKTFYRCMEQSCAIFDLQTNLRFRSMEELLSVLFLRDIRPPSGSSIREAHEQRAILLSELSNRQTYAKKIREAKEKRDETLRLEYESRLDCSVTLLGPVKLLLQRIQACSRVIEAELCASYGRQIGAEPGSDSGSSLESAGLRAQWDAFRRLVHDQLKSWDGSEFPDVGRVSYSYLRWEGHNFSNGDPSKMAAIKTNPFEGCNFVQARERLQEEFKRDRTAAFMQKQGKFREHFYEYYKHSHNALNIFGWSFSPEMSDASVVRSMLNRLIFPEDGYHVFDARCRSSVLRSSDDFTLVLIEIAENNGAQSSASEAARFILSVLGSNGAKEERRYVVLVGSGATGKSTLLFYCAKFAGGKVSQSETANAMNYRNSALRPEFSDENQRFKPDLTKDVARRIIFQYMCYPHSQQEDEGGRDFKASTAVVGDRQVATPVMRQSRAPNGDITSAQKIESMSYPTCNPVDSMLVTNLNPADTSTAVLSRMRWLLYPDGIGNRGLGVSRAQFGKSMDASGFAYLQDMYPLIYLVFHSLNTGPPHDPLISSGAMVSAYVQSIMDNAEDSPVARRYRRLQTSRLTDEPRALMDPNSAIFHSFASRLVEEKKRMSLRHLATLGHEDKNKPPARFTQSEVDAFTDRFQVYLAGVMPAGGNKAVGTGRADNETLREVQARDLIGFIRNAAEHNHSGNSFDSYDLLASCPWMAVPRDADNVFDVLKGVGVAAEIFQPAAIQAARSIIALVMFAATVAPETVQFDEATGYITLKGFYSVAPSSDDQEFQSEANDEDGPGTGTGTGILVPGPVPGELNGTHFEFKSSRDQPRSSPPPLTGPKKTELKRQSSAATSGSGNAESGKEARDRNPTQVAHIKLFNRLCSLRYECPEVPEQYAQIFRLMMLRNQASNVTRDAPFVSSVGMDERAENKLMIHCMLFGLARLLQNAMNLLVHDLSVPKVVLTYDVKAGYERIGGQKVYQRTPTAVVLFPRQCDQDGFPAGSVHRKGPGNTFPSFLDGRDQQKFRQTVGVVDENDNLLLSEDSDGELDGDEYVLLSETEKHLAEVRKGRGRYDEHESENKIDEDEAFFAGIAQEADDLESDPASIPEQTVERLIEMDMANATRFQQTIGGANGDELIPLGDLHEMKKLIETSDHRSLVFAKSYITNRSAKTAIAKLVDSAMDVQQSHGYRIANLAIRVLGDPKPVSSSSSSSSSTSILRTILDEIDRRMAELSHTTNEDSDLLDGYLREVGRYSARVSVADLKEFRLSNGKLETVDVLGTLHANWEQKNREERRAGVKFEPSVYTDPIIEKAHLDRQEGASSSVYSRTNVWNAGVPMSFSLVEEEVQAVSRQMVGYAYFQTHFTNKDRALEKTRLIARVKFVISKLRPLFNFSNTLTETKHGELCYSGGHGTEISSSCPSVSGIAVITKASEYKNLIRTMLLDFLSLMILFTRTTGLQSLYVDPGMCAYQASLLGIKWMHSQVMQIAKLLYSSSSNSIEFDAVLRRYAPSLDKWLARVIAVTPGDRQSILDTRFAGQGSAEFLLKEDFSKDINNLIFYPFPDDESPNRETIRNDFIFTRKPNEPELFRLTEANQQAYKINRSATASIFSRAPHSEESNGRQGHAQLEWPIHRSIAKARAERTGRVDHEPIQVDDSPLPSGKGRKLESAAPAPTKQARLEDLVDLANSPRGKKRHAPEEEENEGNGESRAPAEQVYTEEDLFGENDS